METSAENVCFSHHGFFAIHSFYTVGGEAGFFRSPTASEWILCVAQNGKKSAVTFVNNVLTSAACHLCLRNVSLPVNSGPDCLSATDEQLKTKTIPLMIIL